MKYKTEISAGGIVFKKLITKNNELRTEWLITQHSQNKSWGFPKGLIGDHIEEESKENTALREVKEETGVDAKIVRPLTPVTYWLKLENEKIKKTVYYFLMEYTGGDITKHDHEMENVQFLPVDQVEKRLTYKSDKKVWEQAKKLLVNS